MTRSERPHSRIHRGRVKAPILPLSHPPKLFYIDPITAPLVLGRRCNVGAGDRNIEGWPQSPSTVAHAAARSKMSTPDPGILSVQSSSNHPLRSLRTQINVQLKYNIISQHKIAIDTDQVHPEEGEMDTTA